MQPAILEQTGHKPVSGFYLDECDAGTSGNGNILAGIRQAEYADLIKRRNAPDVLIISHQGEILWISHGSSSILRLLETALHSPEEREARLQLRQTLQHLRRAVLLQTEGSGNKEGIGQPTALFAFREQAVLLRGLRLKGTMESQAFVMIFIEKVKRSVRKNETQCLPGFTPREHAVLRYVKKGFTNKEIACALKIGVHTVKDHVKRIMKKVNVHTRTGIVGKLEENKATFR